MEAHLNKSFANFAELANFIAAETGNQDRSSIYEGALMEHDERAKLSTIDETEQREMPDPEQARAAVEMVMATLVDVFRDTRLWAFASVLAWGFDHNISVVANRITDRADNR